MKHLVGRRELILTSALAAGASTLSAETPLACNLKALTPEERKAHKQRGERLFPAAKVALIASGYSLELPAALWLEAAQWVELERKCCPFLQFQLESEAESGTVVLRLTGRPGVKEFLAEELKLK